MALSEQDTAQSRLGEAYDAHRRMLVATAMGRYGLAEHDAETLVHDVFLAYLIKAGEVNDPKAWLLSAICNASKAFLRMRARVVGLPAGIDNQIDPATLSMTDRLPDELAARECVACLTPRCQLALRLRYYEGYSVPEIAEELGTTAKYAQKLVSRCLQQAQDRYGGARP